MNTLSRPIALFALALIFAVVAVPVAAQNTRAALVIGNSAYASNALTNPVNDATDIAAALREQGFDVLLRTDADYAGMDAALADFQKALKGKDTALFYYAGHGVQADGENYLIPVKEDITSLAKAKSRGVPLADVLGRIKDAGVATALIFLDACRDNPFPGSSRSGTRGLAAIAAPRDVETLIAYATQPGDVAQDGAGRNGVFTAAVLKNLAAPGKTVAEVMTQVKADVKAATSGKQQPRVDDGLSKAFYFNDPALAAAKAQSASAKSTAELAALDAQVAALQAKINTTKDASAKQKLEVEQQRQQALQAAKRLEADNLAAEASRQAQLAAQAQQVSLQRQTAANEAAAKQNELGNLAATRRAELDKLATAAASDNPDVLIDTVERLDAVLKEVDGQYAAALAKSVASTNATWDVQVKAIDKEEADIVESDAEFATRQNQERATLEGKRQADLSQLKASAEAQRVAQTASIRAQFDSTLRTLQTKTWTLTGSAATLTVGTYDRNAKTWPFTVGSADATVPLTPVPLVAELGLANDPATAIRALDAAVKANALTAEVDWGLVRQADQKRYAVEVRGVRVRNLTSNAVVVQNTAVKRAAYFALGQRAKPILAVGTLVVNTKKGDGVAQVYVDGQVMGNTPLTVKLAEGSVSLEVRWTDNYGIPYKGSATLAAGQTTNVVADKPGIKLGDLGPAGGIVFYDKGNSSGGWRYLEAAPSDASNGIQWYNGSNIDVKTDTKIGSGKANTAAIIAAQGEGSYAATLCRDLNLGGFSDWFLPSMDELNLLYTVLAKNGQGGFAKQWYWSSSQDYDGGAWGRGFASGGRASGGKIIRGYVRAVRAF